MGLPSLRDHGAGSAFSNLRARLIAARTCAGAVPPTCERLATERNGPMTGMPVLLNTSFNVRGQPIVRTPREAIDTFLEARLDALAIGHSLLVRRG